MNLRSLRVFVAVMEEATLARAAERLNMSASAASRQLQMLEQEFDVVLFKRVRKRLDPTLEAEGFLPEALRLLSQIDAFPGLFNQLRERAEPPLRVICHPRLVNGLVLPAITVFARSNPDIAVKLDVQPRRDLGRRIMQGLFDLGVAALPPLNEDLTSSELGHFPLGILLSKDHPLADRKVIGTDELLSLPYIALDDTTVARRLIESTLSGVGVRLIPAHEVSTGAAAYRLVADGLGFTFADNIALEPDVLAQTRLVPWREQAEIGYAVFRSATSGQHRAVSAFEEALKAIVDLRCRARGK